MTARAQLVGAIPGSPNNAAFVLKNSLTHEIYYEVRIHGDGFEVRAVNHMPHTDGTLVVRPHATNVLLIGQGAAKKERKA